MKTKNTVLITLGFMLSVLVFYGQSNSVKQNAKKVLVQEFNTDTLGVAYTYWRPKSGPFIGMCGDIYALVFLGVVTEIESSNKETTLLDTAQKGCIKIEEVLKTRMLLKQGYHEEGYFRSDCFYDARLKRGDKVIVYCYEYEGFYAIPGVNSIIKINGFDDPIVASTKTYIASGQNPIKIKKDIALWDKKGFGSALKAIIECKEAYDNKK